MEPVWGIVLAAGRGSRFGGDKLTATLRGQPVLGRTLRSVMEARRAGWLSGVVTVVSAEESVAAGLARSASSLVQENRDFSSGIASSVKRGLEALASLDAAAALIIPGDQPEVRAEVIAELVTAWKAGAAIARPVYRGDPATPGHPVLLDRKLWRLAEQVTGDQGLGPLLASRSDVVSVAVIGTNPDIDTPADLARLEDCP